MNPSRSEFLQVRKARYHVRHWGDPQAPLLLMLHGHMDVSASFQFLVDALRGDWHVAAPDWRGHGESDWHGGTYWLSEYVADLHTLVREIGQGRPVHIAAHSMGGYVAGLYAGIAPEQVATLVNLDGYVVIENRSGASVARHYARWLDGRKRPIKRTTYASPADLAVRLQEGNPRLPAERAAFLAEHMTRARADGRYDVLLDPVLRLPRPVSIPQGDFLAARGLTTAPVLCVRGSASHVLGTLRGDEQQFAAQMRLFRCAREEVIDGAGHNLHHEQPERLAVLIERHVAEHAATQHLSSSGAN